MWKGGREIEIKAFPPWEDKREREIYTYIMWEEHLTLGLTTEM